MTSSNGRVMGERESSNGSSNTQRETSVMAEMRERLLSHYSRSFRTKAITVMDGRCDVVQIGHLRDRIDRHLWMSSSRAIESRYSGLCVFCRERYTPGASIRHIFRLPEGGGDAIETWVHDTCAKAEGIPAFVGKS